MTLHAISVKQVSIILFYKGCTMKLENIKRVTQVSFPVPFPFHTATQQNASKYVRKMISCIPASMILSVTAGISEKLRIQ